MARRGYVSRIRQNARAYLFISPFYIIFAFFGLYPIIYSFYLSLNKWHATKAWQFVAFKNYYDLLFNDPVFWTSVWNVVFIFLINVPPMIILSVIIAVALNNPSRRFKDFSALPISFPMSLQFFP